MSHVQLQVRPRRTQGAAPSCEPPPFRFDGAAPAVRQTPPSPGVRLLHAPIRAFRLLLVAVGGLVDAAFFLAGLTVWCAMHLALWSYAFDMGPAANCFGLPCPAYLTNRALLACGTLAVLTFLVSRLLRKLGHNATSAVLLVLVTFDVAAMLLLALGIAR